MAKIGIAALAVIILVPVLIAALIQGAFSAIFGSGSPTQPSATALADIPADYLALYRQAATTCPGLDWSVLAAIGKIESDHGRSTLPGVQTGTVNEKGAGGQMQFLKPTFDSVISRHPIPPGGASPPSRYNPHDAIFAAAFYLCDSGTNRGDINAAILTYNHSEQYLHDVLAQAKAYADATTVGTGDCNNIHAATPAALAAINYACGQRGLPYVWAGNGPTDGGFDCSGLTTTAYGAAGIPLPRTADAQFRAGPRVPDGQPLLPGDLVFYGTSAYIHHVGLYIGGGLMIDAPDFGQVVKIQPYRYQGDDYAGATRPTK